MCYPLSWVWLKIDQEGLRGFWSMFPLTRVPFWYRFFEPHPHPGVGGPPCRLGQIKARAHKGVGFSSDVARALSPPTGSKVSKGQSQPEIAAEFRLL